MNFIILDKYHNIIIMKLLTNTPHFSSYKQVKFDKTDKLINKMSKLSIKKTTSYKISNLVSQISNITIQNSNKNKLITRIDLNIIRNDLEIKKFIKKILHTYLSTTEFNNKMIELFEELDFNTDSYIPINLFLTIDKFELNNETDNESDNENNELDINTKFFIDYNIITNALNINNIFYNKKRINKFMLYNINRFIN